MIQPLQRRFLIYLIALASSLIAPLCHSGHENEKLQVLAQIRNPDLVRRDADGNITIDNRATRLVEAVLVEADIDYEIRLYPWARILQELSAYKNVIAYPMARTASRDSEMHRAGIIRPVDLHLYGLRSKEAELPQSLNEAHNSSLGVIRDDISDDYLTAEGFSGLIRVNDLSNAITMLERGRFDLFPFEAHEQLTHRLFGTRRKAKRNLH